MSRSLPTEYIKQQERHFHSLRQGQPGHCRIYEVCPCGCRRIRSRDRRLTFFTYEYRAEERTP
jgi:hypothetical protein